ncbi:DUF2207 domain-containing protein [Nonomuraea antimicrobica]
MTGIRLTMAALAATALTLTAAPAALAAQAGITDEVTMTLGKDGTLHVVEKISGASGPLKRTFITRTRYDDTTDRVYRITNVKGGTLAGDVLTVTGQTVEYDVMGAVTTSGGVEELRWFAVNGWNQPVAKATVQVSGPGQVQNLSCFAGELTSAIGCTSASMDHVATRADFEQANLSPARP